MKSVLAILLLAQLLPLARAQELRIGNKAVEWRGEVVNGKLRPVEVDDKINGQTLPLTGNCFELVLGDSTVLSSADFQLAGAPEIGALKCDPSSPTLARHFPGQQLVAKFSAPDRHLSAEWRVILRDGSTYVRQELALQAAGEDVLVKEIVLFDQKVSGAKTDGSVEGSPAVAGNFFLGYEHPMARNEVGTNDVVRCSFLRNAVLKNGETLTQALVTGVTPAGQLRRGFLAYVERERAHPYRPFCITIRGMTSRGSDRKYDETQSLNVIDLRPGTGRKRGVKLDSFLFDDGWDDNQTLWQFQSRFSQRLRAVEEGRGKISARHRRLAFALGRLRPAEGAAAQIRQPAGFEIQRQRLFPGRPEVLPALPRHLCGDDAKIRHQPVQVRRHRRRCAGG